MESAANAAFSLNRKLPPQSIPANIAGILTLIEEEDTQDEVAQRIDQPLEYGDDTETNLKFLKCEYNRDGDSWRSPFSNQYFPPLDAEVEDAYFPSGQLLELEKGTNKVLSEYTSLYFGDADASAYYFETTDTGFGACFLIKSHIQMAKGVESSQWDSIHTFTVEEAGGQHTYTLVSTIFLHLAFSGDHFGKAKIAGTSTKKTEKSYPSATENKQHLERMGGQMEQNESWLRNEMDNLYVNKTKQIINSARLTEHYKNNKLL